MYFISFFSKRVIINNHKYIINLIVKYVRGPIILERISKNFLFRKQLVICFIIVSFC